MLPFRDVSTLGVMAGGRLIFGLGAESLIVAVTTAVAKWFRGKELSFAFGINLMLARAGSFAAQFSPTWAQAAYREWRLPLVISVGFGALCVIGAIIYWGLESHGERHYDLGESSTDKINWSDLSPLVPSFVLGAALAGIVYFREKLLGSWRVLAAVLGILVIVTLVQAIVRFGGRSYLYIVALCIVFYSAIFPFETFAYKFFIDSHHVTRETAGQLVGMLTLFTMFGTPLFGLFSDRVGKRALLMMGGSLMLIPVYLMMAYTNVSLYIPMAMMGISFALIPAVMWPSVAYIVEQNKLGTAYGLMTMIQNIGLAGFNLLIGRENDLMHASAQNSAGYHLGMWTFSILGFLGVTFALLLRARETGPHGHGLETITTRSAA
jgi:MFS family permease